MSIQDTIREQVTAHPVVLYMKGTPQFPQCGFSTAAVQMLKRAASTSSSRSTCLPIPRSGRASRTTRNWPTIPQLYVNGEFVGGCDIMREMYEAGELQQLLAKQAA